MKIGLTGGIGCGKSTVTGIFAEAGWSTLQTDTIVRELLDQDVGVQSALRDRWQEAVFRPDGTVDRKAIARQVFENTTELNWLESLLHPKVRNVWETALARAPELSWLVEIPLLFEKKLETKFDSTICVISTPTVVENRMILRGYSLNEIRQRRQWQMSLEEKICRSDYVISNSGSLEFLNLQTQRLIQQIRQLT
ncbi:MAG: dephospho-CoA kinase [Lentimonas sp.]